MQERARRTAKASSSEDTRSPSAVSPAHRTGSLAMDSMCTIRDSGTFGATTTCSPSITAAPTRDPGVTVTKPSAAGSIVARKRSLSFPCWERLNRRGSLRPCSVSVSIRSGLRHHGLQRIEPQFLQPLGLRVKQLRQRWHNRVFPRPLRRLLRQGCRHEVTGTNHPVSVTDLLVRGGEELRQPIKISCMSVQPGGQRLVQRRLPRATSTTKNLRRRAASTAVMDRSAVFIVPMIRRFGGRLNWSP